jgi:hypothetical protein
LVHLVALEDVNILLYISLIKLKMI